MAETRDYSSIYSIKDFIINQVCPQYFDIDDVSLSNVGLLGVISDISGTTSEDNFRTTARYINELLPGKASLPDFCYAKAANYGITDIFASCSHCSALLFIKEDDVLTHGEKKDAYTEFILDSSLTVFIDDIPFSIPYDIVIRTTTYDGEYNHHCTYRNNITNSIVPLNSPYIRCMKSKITGENTVYLALAVTLYQYQRTLINEIITTNSKLNIPYVETEFSDMLCNFEILYTGPNSNTQTQLLKYLESMPATITPFTYYKMIDEDKIRFSFTNDDRYFIPEYNSELDILMYTTLGEMGVFKKYSGENIYVTTSSDDTSLAYNNEISVQCIMTSDSIGGSDSYTLEELNLMTYNAQLSLLSYTTDNDLEVHFKTFSELYDIGYKFIKIRDDSASREHVCYTRLKDDTTIFPTNTLNVLVELDKVDGYDPEHLEYAIIVEPGTPLVYLKDDNSTCIIGDDNPEDGIVYTSIALMSIELNPNNVAFYMNSVNKSVVMTYEYTNNNARFQFIIKDFTIKREAVCGDKGYDIMVSIIPSDVSLLTGIVYGDDGDIDTLSDDIIDEEFDEEVEDEDSFVDDEEVIDDESPLSVDKLSLYLYATTNTGHYLKLDYDSSSSSSTEGLVFRGTITTNDRIIDDAIELNSLVSCETQHEQTCSVKMENPDIRLLVFYDEDSNDGGHQYSGIIPDTSNYTLTNTFKPDNDELYFAYPLSTIRSSVSFEPASSDAGFAIKLYDVPLFAKEFLLDEYNMKKSIEFMTAEHSFLENTLSNVIQNTSIFMRFYNTYGHSSIFTLSDGTLLNRTNCTLDLSIKFKDNVDDGYAVKEIKVSCKNYIESLNDSETSGVNSIKMSELIYILHSTYSDYIDYIIFNSINDYPPTIQTITMNLDLSSSANISSIPEFLTIGIDDITITPI